MKKHRDRKQVGNAGSGGPVVEGFINKVEVGKRLNMQTRTVTGWMKRGWLPYYKVGRAVRFKWSEVEAYLRRTYRVCGASACSV
jgi:excisionase family DNA binding protein